MHRFHVGAEDGQISGGRQHLFRALKGSRTCERCPSVNAAGFKIPPDTVRRNVKLRIIFLGGFKYHQQRIAEF